MLSLPTCFFLSTRNVPLLYISKQIDSHVKRFLAMNKAALFSCVGALAAGLYTAYVDFHATEVSATMLVVVSTSFVLGFLYGRLAWLWAVIIAGCLTAAHVLAPSLRLWFGISPRDAGNIGNPLSLMIVALPAALSAYFAAGIRSVARLSRSQRHV
jgi:hypothetical protein